MATRKRGRQQVALEEGLINIKLADSAPLSAKSLILRSCSSCAEGLPADAQEWDLSQLQIEGQDQLQREAVVCWLNCAYDRILNIRYDDQELDLRSTVEGLTQLLAFADAVGSTGGVLAACTSKLNGLQLHVALDDPPFQVCLETDGRAYYFCDQEEADGNISTFIGVLTPEAHTWLSDDPLSEDDVKTFQQGVAQQTEALLYQAHRLQLQPLISRLHTFIASSTHIKDGILFGQLASVFKDRVFEIVLPGQATQADKDAWLSSVLTQPCGFKLLPSVNHLLQRTTAPTVSRAGTLRFGAKLRKRFMGGRAGADVNIMLDLFEQSQITIGRVKYPVQLLLGQPITKDSDRVALMGDPAAAAADESE